MRTLCSMLAAVLALVPGGLAADGGTGAAFLNLDAGADVIAQGGAAAARGGTAGAVFGNPGDLGWLWGTELTFGHAEHVQSVRHEHLAVARGFGRLAVALSVRSLTLGGMEERTVPSETPLSLFDATDLAPAVTVARVFGRRYAVGTSVKLVHQRVGADRATSFANDIGVSVVTGIAGLRAGAVLANWGSGVTFTDRSYPLPTRLRAGLGYALPGRPVTAAGDLVLPFHRPPFACLGAEAVVRRRLGLRAGYRGGSGGAGGLAGLTAGLGVKVRELDVDYAYASHGVLGAAHHVSLSFVPGRAGGRDERAIAAELQRRARITAETFYQRGLAQLQEDKPEEALGNFDLALVWDPGYHDAGRASAETRAKLDDRRAGQLLAEGLAHYRGGGLIDAIAEFGRVLEIKPGHQAARDWLTTASNALVQARAAGDTLRGIAAAQVDRHMQAGAALLSAKDYGGAIREWQQALALDPNHPAAAAAVADARALQQQAVAEELRQADRFAARGKWPSALARVDRALSHDPEHGDAQAKKREFDAAVRDLAARHAKLGIDLFQQGRYEQAVVELKLALALDPGNKPAAEHLAKAASQRAIGRRDDLNDLYLKGINAYTQEEYQQAIAYWQRVVEIDPGHTNARRNIERARQKLKIISQ
ncbi:MAG: PorV/PorQ family protein [Candidatus Edwardsbacteria bacterium]|jgi:tetratricopeptide (TPR) repeat protein|nr:PorV/PorQ family protein [Candidatus Edwardsbacteria bacterium]